MSTKTDFYLGRGHDAEWLGSLQWECEPENLLHVTPGRFALTATDELTYRAAVADLFITNEVEKLGAAYLRRTGWPWPEAPFGFGAFPLPGARRPSPFPPSPFEPSAPARKSR